MEPLESRLKTKARDLGFDLVGITAAMTPPGTEQFRKWLANGYGGEMGYMTKHAAAREHPDSILDGVRSIVMVGMNYHTGIPSPPIAPGGTLTGRISNYAWGSDYHDVLWQRLDELLKWVQAEVPTCRGRSVVDTAPLLERDFARLAGLGWFGKNTMLINKKVGSFFFIGALLLDIDLESDPPFALDHCGTCTACLDACPTQAFVGPGELDARRCISYLTIELRQPIPLELREPMGDWIYGCDICQDVCPWNRKAPASAETAFQPRPGLATPDLIELLQLSPEAFRERFRDSAMTRPKRGGLLRNVAIALGNSGDERAVPPLINALQDDEPLVRGAAAWALSRIDAPAARLALNRLRKSETNSSVLAELQRALETASKTAVNREPLAAWR